jgi:hypothetical protein
MNIGINILYLFFYERHMNVYVTCYAIWNNIIQSRINIIINNIYFHIMVDTNYKKVKKIYKHEENL